MADLQTVCCLCGDIGFPDKLFRCNKCHHRFQHSYCSNYYGEVAEIELCDWCQREEKNARHSGSYNNPRRSTVSAAGNDVGSTASRSEYSSKKVKQQQHHDRDREDQSGGSGSDKGKTAGAPSPRQNTRRYKLLKDVMC
ncbi:hypothetical protein K1719_026662 [Acacia pycnantha]|nr:hypothetical protein K1719_039551 [Acacia pycnantha]KAI9094542.1 hypothetical protein K1719_026662 [Acacia pycnantha]